MSGCFFMSLRYFGFALAGLLALPALGAESYFKVGEFYHADPVQEPSEGFAGALSLDGDILLVGAFDAIVNDQIASGAAYFFERDATGVWIQRQRITDPDATALDLFGAALALEGDTALISADAAIVNGNNFQGAVYFYRRDATSGEWVLAQKLTASDGQRGDFFGSDVALDGDTALIGAHSVSTNNDPDNPNLVGAAYVFTRGADGVWTQTQRLDDPDQNLGDYFGRTVALAGDTALVGASVDVNGVENAGAVYVYQRDIADVWRPQAKLTANDSQPSQGFGTSGLALDGDTMLIGSHNSIVNGLPAAGALYVFKRDTAGNWQQQTKLTAPVPANGARFGLRAGIKGDTLFVRSTLFSLARATAYGVVYIFRYDAGNETWNEVQSLTVPVIGSAARNGFGSAFALQDNTAIVGAGGLTVEGIRAGGAFFELETVPGPTVNLIAELEADQTQIDLGAAVTYTARVNNADMQTTATNAVLSAPLPQGASLISVGATCVLADELLTCPLGDLAPGAAADTVVYTLALNEPGEFFEGEIQHAVSVNADQPERDMVDNHAAWTVTLNPAPEPEPEPAPSSGGGASGFGLLLLLLLLSQWRKAARGSCCRIHTLQKEYHVG